ncbi:MAG: hypothetical protein NC339_02810 [Muribaculaceae bacterium]|nr:hypothetical protein [Muribaculaceae bacterium]
MTPLLSRISAAITDPTTVPLQGADVEEAARLYPYFTLPAVEYLRLHGSDADEATRRRLMNRIAMNAPDPASLFMLVNPEASHLRNFYPEERKEMGTDDAITKFLETYGSSDPSQDALLERLIFNPVPPDYTSLLEMEGADTTAAAPQSAQDSLIDAFLASAPDEDTAVKPEIPLREPEPVAPETHHITPPEDSSLSESLAKIYIRQKRYDKAFEIIHTLSLNNPKKSAYFADQLRFLAKLMLIKKHQSN